MLNSREIRRGAASLVATALPFRASPAVTNEGSAECRFGEALGSAWRLGR
jgi:hypothetical protein